ncbi:uncharacterized protein F4812DRAFT_461312 [Daldinia caldariorum]|uniref:uncharacterized protein n=1 Tax=Daldinia caldariorum TaxID=326644 RepID=UPI002008D3ED|nr:uncharacterized protein F4812DRAFT_461312 [Daldinia caldariorum]KAI1465620.1 hypothetical protein F4812DRAFT_461312 [Daldinia caldariorum]
MEKLNEDNGNLPKRPFQNSDLLEAFESIRKKNSVASMIRLGDFNPEIFVKDVGMIDNPLSETQAKQLIAKSRQAPSEEDQEIVENTPGPKIWELPLDQFEIRAPIWQSHLNKVLGYIAKKLDVASPIYTEFYKMLLYEPGATSKTSNYNENVPGMFGRLVISLPSPYEGGDVVVKYCGASKTLPTSQHHMACAFWYVLYYWITESYGLNNFLVKVSDASYEVLSIESGYHWVLVYNLTTDPTAPIPTAASRLEDNRLRVALESWSREVSDGSKKPLPLCYALDDRCNGPYGIKSIQELKDADRERARRLRNMCTDLDFDLFLSILEKQETRIVEDNQYGGWGWDDRENEGWNTSYKLKTVTDFEGNMLTPSIELDEDSILQENPFPVDPCDVEYLEYPGVAKRIRVRRFYTSKVLVIVPSRQTVPLLLSGGIRQLKSECEASSRKATRLDQLYETLSVNASLSFSTQELTPGHLSKIFQLSMESNDYRLSKLIMTEYKRPPPTEFFAWLGRQYDRSVISMDDFSKIFQLAFDLQPTIYRRWSALCDANVDLEEDQWCHLRSFVSRTVSECLELYRKQVQLQEEDGKALFGLSFYQLGLEYLKTTVTPILEAHGGLTAFLLGFLQSFDFKYSQTPKEDMQAVYERIAHAALINLDLNALTSAEIPLDVRVNGRRSPRIPQYVTYKSMSRFILRLIELKLPNHLDCLAQGIANEIIKVQGYELDTLWMPLLHELLIAFEKRRAILQAPCWTRIYQSVFKAYVLNFVRQQPQTPCDCRYCSTRYGSRAQYDVEMDCWHARRIYAESVFETFDQEMLQTVLGDQYSDIVNLKLLKPPQPTVCARQQRVNACLLESTPATSYGRSPGPSYTPPNPYSPLDSSRLYMASSPYTASPPPPLGRLAPRPTPKRSMLEVSRVISESANKRRSQSKLSSPARHSSAGASSPAGGSNRTTSSRPTQMIPNPIAGDKCKFIEVIDLTDD